LDDIWPECQIVYEKHAFNGKGAAGKKNIKVLSALVRGRSSAAVSMIETNTCPMQLMKFQIAHNISWLELDPISLLALMLSLGAYGLGTSWIASAHGGKVEQLRFACYLKTHQNGLLASCRTMLAQVLFGERNDDHVLAFFRRSRNALLPSLDICARMTLDELQANCM